jgi:hypothetical protein
MALAPMVAREEILKQSLKLSLIIRRVAKLWEITRSSLGFYD